MLPFRLDTPLTNGTGPIFRDRGGGHGGGSVPTNNCTLTPFSLTPFSPTTEVGATPSVDIKLSATAGGGVGVILTIGGSVTLNKNFKAVKGTLVAGDNQCDD